ncbi:hypothetical protein F5B22DRAFT_641443 [Xylaria bambusicola]|uniref:uncharacterized protein n=1 Tax=Xylaria bambusicola TaxID=326684 RepID=UPI002008726A|nr:uncharacterized protein F5B22DRAFT_641443 [Xylaria bambusicola]KAI0526294.1 hypothetical protein F5B22DRAFT_641443 [Xylaria bambusicola]
MRIPPLEVIASWPKPNYINPESRAPVGRVVGSSLLIIVTLILLIRLYSRKQLTKGCGLDDALICLAYLPATAFTVTGIITQEDFQWGRHIWDVEPKFYRSNLVLTLVHLFLFDLATSLTKLSMLAMVRRLTTASNNKVENAIVLALAVLITTNCFIFIMVETFQCRPVSYGWTLHRAQGNCINEEAHIFSAGIINTVTDFAVVLLPIRTAMRIQLSPRQRVIVASLFGIGLVASAAGIARTVFTWLLLNASDYDETWRSWYVWLTSLIELHLGIICASAPATKPFFTQKRREASRVLPSHFPPPPLYGEEDSLGMHSLLNTGKDTSFRGSSASFADTSTTHSPHQSRHVYMSPGPSRQV